MDIEISLQDYLEQIKEQFKLDSNMSYDRVLVMLKKEVQFRESLINSIVEKTYRLLEYIKKFIPKEDVNKIKNRMQDLRISGLEDFELIFRTGGSHKIEFFKRIIEIKLDYIFNVEFYTQFGDIVMRLTLNHDKLDKIKRYI